MSSTSTSMSSTTAYCIRSPEELNEVCSTCLVCCSYTNYLQYKEVVDSVKLEDLRKAIPAHCFKPLYLTSFWYLFRDIALASITMTVGFLYIPLIENAPLRYAAWTAYGYLEGLTMTGLWVYSILL